MEKGIFSSLTSIMKIKYVPMRKNGEKYLGLPALAGPPVYSIKWCLNILWEHLHQAVVNFCLYTLGNGELTPSPSNPFYLWIVIAAGKLFRIDEICLFIVSHYWFKNYSLQPTNSKNVEWFSARQYSRCLKTAMLACVSSSVGEQPQFCI